MERLWLITNHASGSAGEEKCAAIEAVCAERGLCFVGRTEFPGEELPDAARLEAAGADTVLLFAGDGTINAAARRLDDWGGQVLILPGGTMNMLAKRLHGDADAAAILHAAHGGGRAIRLPSVAVGDHRAFVALIIGPAAAWGHAREIVREGRFSRLARAVRLAWARSWTERIEVHDGKRLCGRYNAAIVTPREDGCLGISAVAAERWRDVARLGWEWLVGNWHDAPAVDDSRSGALTVTGRAAVHALFDGEEAKLASPIAVRAALGHLAFISTIEAR